MASRLMGGGGQSANLENIGDTVAGFVVEEPTEAQQTEYQDKSKLKFYKNGQPAMMSIVKLQTQQRNDQADDGVRLVFVADLSDKQQEIARAIRATGASDIEVGGYLQLSLVNKVIGQNNNLKNVWQAHYQRPQQQSGLMAQPQQQQPQFQQPVQQPQYQQPQFQQPVQQQPQFQPNPAAMGQQQPQYQQPVQQQQPQFQAPQAQQQQPNPAPANQFQGLNLPNGVDPAAVQAAFEGLGGTLPQQMNQQGQ